MGTVTNHSQTRYVVIQDINLEGQHTFFFLLQWMLGYFIKGSGYSMNMFWLSSSVRTLEKLIWLWIMFTAKKKKKISVKHRLQWWCKLVVDFPSLNDWAEERGWGVINPWLVMTAQAKMGCSGGWARTLLLWLVLGCGTNFQRPRRVFSLFHPIGRFLRGTVAPFCCEPVKRTRR